MNTDLRAFTTFQLGGPCREIRHLTTAAELADSIHECRRQRQSWRVIGGGSNLLISDHGLPDVIFHTVENTPQCTRGNGHTIQATAGTHLDDVVRFAISETLQGLEFASGIPGTLGGAIAGNAGAFGQQLSDVIRDVEVVCPSGEIKHMQRDELDFQYRRSIFQKTSLILTRACLQLAPGDAAELTAKRDDILAIRKEKHPDISHYRSAGSFFKNLPPAAGDLHRQAAGKLLDAAGALEFRVGGAYVFPKHANIIIAGEHATANDVAQLAAKMQQAVFEKFNVKLHPEVRYWGEFDM